MLHNFLTVALRNLQRNSFYSVINIAGLALGIACSMLIMLWVVDEISYDRFHKNYSRLYQVYINQKYEDQIYSQSKSPYGMYSAVRERSARVKYSAMLNNGEGNLLTAGDKKLNKWGYSATEDFLKMFTFESVKGDPATALSDPTSMVITESTARELFGNADPINKTILIDNEVELKVAAVVRDVPDQSTFKFDYLLPFAYFEATQGWVRDARNQWRNFSFQVFVELQSEDAEADVNAAIEDLVRKNAVDRETASVFLHPISSWRLFSNFEHGKPSGGMILYVRLFTGIAVFILVIACINFMNLSTARSEKRAREVGIRKSIGSSRQQLVFQFLGESLITTVISFLLALMMVELLLTPYNTLVGKHLNIPYGNAWFWIVSLSTVLGTGFIAGSYPAFYLSGFNPVNVLKGKVMTSHGASTPRKFLVTLQFGFSTFLIIGTTVIHQQVMHVKNREVGYEREGLMLVWTNSEMEKNYASIKEELRRSGVVKAVTKSSAPITRIFSSTDVEWQGKDPGRKVGFATVATEYDYTETMGIRMLEGRDFSKEFLSDSQAVIINKVAADMIGFKEPIGARITMWGDERTIIGVMEDVVMDSPYKAVDPMALVLIPGWSSTINVRLERTKDLSAAIATVESVFKKLNPSFPIIYRFADDEFDTKFASINLISRLAGIFAFLAIFITCLGLFGLSAFTAEQRRKELGIRKVLGATVSGLILLISKDFSRLILVAFVIASPLAWWGLSEYLKQYPYRIDIAWWVLPAAGVFSLALGLVIVGTQAMRAAKSNPAEALKSE